jgi:hypothetical protein
VGLVVVDRPEWRENRRKIESTCTTCCGGGKIDVERIAHNVRRFEKHRR